MDSVVDEKKPASAPPVPSRILIRSSNWLGDAVMTVPAVRAIRRSFPDAQIAVLTRSKLADFWKNVPEVNEVVAVGQNAGVLSVAGKIRRRFDAALVLPNSVRTALEVWLARIPRRAGARAKKRSSFLTDVFDRDKTPHAPRHQMNDYLDLAEFFGAKIEEADRDTERVFSTLRTPHSALRIGLCPGAEYGAAKRWLPERFAEVVKTVSARRECEWVLLGTQKDAAVGGEIAKQLDGKNFTNLIGKTTLTELIATLRECRVLLTNDTGTMHLAAFLGVPTVSIFGSTEPAFTGPLGAGHRVLRHHVACSPCFLRECPLDFRCMKAIEPDEAAEAVLRMLGD
jgi:lipopolysaccharide heptosyltransferase II